MGRQSFSSCVENMKKKSQFNIMLKKTQGIFLKGGLVQLVIQK